MTTSTEPSVSPASVAACSFAEDEPGQEADLEREGSEPLAERAMVLGGEDRRRDEDRDLLAILRRLERGSERDLGLAVADVAHDQAVHRPDALHVLLGLGHGAQLVDGLLVRERRLQLRLPWRVSGEGVPLCLAPRRVQLEQLLRQVRDGPPDPLLRAQPFGPAELAQLRLVATGVARHPPDLLDRNEDAVAARERQLEEVSFVAGRGRAPQHLLEAGDAVVDVDHEVAGGQPFEDVARHDPPHRLRPADPDIPEQLAVGDERDALGAADEAAVEAALDDRDRARRRCLGQSGHDRGRVSCFGEDLGETRRLVGGEHDPRAVAPASPRRPPGVGPHGQAAGAARATRTRAGRRAARPSRCRRAARIPR